MMKTLYMEFYKMRNKGLGFVVIALIAIQMLWALWAMRYMNADELAQGWMSFMYSFAQINCIFMPIFIAVIASRLSDVEHKENYLKLMETFLSQKSIFNSKFLCGSVYIFMAVILQMVLMISLGNFKGVTQQLPVSRLIYYFSTTLIISLTLFLIQLVLSLLFENQMIAFITAITGTFLGLYSLFFDSISKYVIWGYYGALSVVRMNWNKDSRIVDFYWVNLPVNQILILGVIFIMLYITGKKLFMRKEL